MIAGIQTSDYGGLHVVGSDGDDSSDRFRTPFCGAAKGLADGLDAGIRRFAQGHSADKWQNWNLNAGSTPKPTLSSSFQTSAPSNII